MNKQIFIFLIMFLISFQNFAQELSCDSFAGKGRFYSTDDDSLSFIKKQLLHNAFKNVITKKMKCLGFDVEHFWKNYDVKFEKYFLPIKELLENKYPRLDEKGKKVVKNIKNFKKSLRYKMMLSKRKFGGFSQVISSYSIKKMSRSTKYPNARFLSISAKVSAPLLTKMYYKFTQEKSKRIIDKIYISASFNLEKMSWVDLDVLAQQDFERAIKNSWKKWIITSWDNSIKEVIVLDEMVVQDFFKSSSSKTKINMKEGEKDEVVEQEISRNAFWLKLDINLKKTKENKLIGMKEFEIDGQFILQDILTGKIIGDYNFVRERKTYFLDKNINIASSIATMIYRIPLAAFEKQNKKIVSMGAKMNFVTLELKEIDSIRDIFQFNEMIKNRGSKFQITPYLKSYNGTLAKIGILFRGNTSEMRNFLFSLKNTSVNNQQVLFSQGKEDPYKLKLVKKQ